MLHEFLTENTKIFQKLLNIFLVFIEYFLTTPERFIENLVVFLSMPEMLSLPFNLQTPNQY